MPSVDGIVSGLDTSSLIDAITEASAVSLRTAEGRKAQADQQLTDLGEFKSRLSTVQTSLETLGDAEQFAAFTASVGDEDAMTVTVDSAASTGSHTVLVRNLAVAEVERSQSFASDTSTGYFASGTFKVTVGSDSHDVTMDSSMSLVDLAEAIDAVDGVKAYVLDVGTGSKPYRLMVTSENTGTDDKLSFSSSGLSGGTKPSFTQQVAAADARITIDGLNVYSKSNTMTGVLPGVTMDLTNTSSNFKLTINRDDTAMIEKVQAFVDNYNTLVGFVDTNNNFSSDSGSRGSFFGDSTISGIMAGMGSAVGQIYTASDGSTELSLARMGIQTQQDGSLKLDTSELKDALAADYQDVVGAFTDPDGPVNALADQISDVYLDNSSGLVKLRTDTVESRIEDMEESIIDLEERITAQEERLRSQFTAMEVALGQLQSSQSYLDALLAQSSGKK